MNTHRITSFLSVLMLILGICTCGCAEAPIVLTVSGNMHPGWLDEWFNDHPEVVMGTAERMSGDEYIAEFLTQSQNIDVMFFQTVNASPYQALRDRGYFYPIQNETLLEAVQNMYPDIIEAATFDGQIVGVPLGGIIQDGIGINTALCEKMGIDRSQYPKTWRELCEFTADWGQISKQYPGVKLFNNGEQARLHTYYRMLNAYTCLCTAQGSVVDYASEPFSEALRLYEQTDFSEQDDDGRSEDNVLFANPYGLDPQMAGIGFDPLPLVFEDDSEPYIFMMLDIAVINPHSTHIEMAEELLAYGLSRVSKANAIRLGLDRESEGVRFDEYESTRAEMVREKDRLKRMAQSATNDGEKRELESDALHMDALIEEFDRYGGWLILPEAVANYRAAIGHMGIYYEMAVNEADSAAIDDLSDQYLEGTLPRQALINNLNRMVVMRYREG